MSKATAPVATRLTTNLALPTVRFLLAILQVVPRHVVGTTTPFSRQIFYRHCAFLTLKVAAANSAGPSLSIMTALAWVNSCSALIVSILDEACRRCLMCWGSPETNVPVNQRSGSGPPTNQASRRSSRKKLVHRLTRAKFSSDELVICIKFLSSIRGYEGLLDLFGICFLLRTKLPVYG